MRYTRSSFLKWLKESRDCEITPRKHTNVLKIANGLITANMWVNPKDVIDYEEIYMLCNKLMIVGLPGDQELEVWVEEVIIPASPVQKKRLMKPIGDKPNKKTGNDPQKI